MRNFVPFAVRCPFGLERLGRGIWVGGGMRDLGWRRDEGVYVHKKDAHLHVFEEEE